MKPSEFHFVCPYAKGVTRLDQSLSSGARWVVDPYRGQKLWVKETWRCFGGAEYEYQREPGSVIYRATAEVSDLGPWKPSIFMSRWASRITLDVIGLRIERLQDITEEDARAEGVERDKEPCDHTRLLCSEIGCLGPTHRSSYAELWDRRNGDRKMSVDGQPLIDVSWRGNPWVWVVTFPRATVVGTSWATCAAP